MTSNIDDSSLSLPPIRIIKPDDSIALLSDFDGTLARINPNPYLTVIEPAAKDALEQLVTRPNIFPGIISGRPMYNVKKLVGLDNCTYSGNHGMEIVFANKTEFHYPITAEMFANVTKLKNILYTKVTFLLFVFIDTQFEDTFIKEKKKVWSMALRTASQNQRNF